ncbi:MAG: LysE family transporter [Woeseia sp.]
MYEQLVLVATLTVLVMISPGPDMVIVMRNTIVGGRAAGLQTSLGVLGGNLVHISYCLLGIGWVISQSIVVFSVIKFAGAAYLIYLGICSFRHEQTSLRVADITPVVSRRTWLLQGFINNLLNPKGTLFYLGVFTVVITPQTTAGTTGLLVASTVLVSALFWLFFVYTLDRPAVRRFIDRSQQTVSRVFGVVLLALGVRVALLER